jgi:hypothetical protein
MKQYIFFNGLDLFKHYELIFQLSKNYIKTSINIQSMMDFIIKYLQDSHSLMDLLFKTIINELLKILEHLISKV